MIEFPQLKRIIEAALLAAAQPLSLPQLSALFGETETPSHDDLARALGDLAEECANRGVELKEVASGFRYQVKQDVHPWVARLWTAGARNFCINAGGDVVAYGRPAPGRRWRVGIRHPDDLERVAAVLAVEDRAVATSGEYERGAHIRDPHTGRAPEGLLSVTVVGPDLATADAYATAAFAMGADGPAWTATLEGYDAMCVTANHRVLTTPAFARHRA